MHFTVSIYVVLSLILCLYSFLGLELGYGPEDDQLGKV